MQSNHCKMILIALLLLMISSAFAGIYHDYACSFLSIDPSVTNRALGLTTGAANIWHSNALMAYANPALPALHEGMSLGSIFDNEPEQPNQENIFYHGSLITLAHSGIALTLPSLNTNVKAGLTMDYGQEQSYQPLELNQNFFSLYESSAVYGFSISPLRLYRSFTGQDSQFKNLEVSLGCNYVDVYSKIGNTQMGNYYYHDGNDRSRSIDTGILAKYAVQPIELLKLQGVVGLAHFNVFKNKIHYFNEVREDLLYSHRNLGLALAASIPARTIATNEEDSWYFKDKDFLALRFLSSSLNYYYNTANVTGNGLEFSFLDTVYFRRGHYKNILSKVQGDTYGFGINLDYKNIIVYSFEYANFPGGEFKERRESYENNLTINFTGLYLKLKH